MSCERLLQEDVAGAYLRGELPEHERDAFEQHFFECADCFERLRVLRELGGVLREQREPARAAMVPRRRGAPAVGWLAWAAGAAFVAVGAAFVLRNVTPYPPGPAPAPAGSPTAGPTLAPSPAPAATRPPLEALARVEPPPYAPLVVRGAEPPDDAFSAAMGRYVGGDYAGAAAGLRGLVNEDPAAVEARFYLGVSELLAGRPEQAIRDLTRVAGGDDAGFAAAARYYLAKAHLGRRDVAAARRELQRVAQGEGDHKERAQQLLEALGTEP